MKKTILDLEVLIKSYAKTTSPNGIFISVLENDKNLSKILNVPTKDFFHHVDDYFYLSHFKSKDEANELFNRIENECHPNSQYAVLVLDNEIVREYPNRE